MLSNPNTNLHSRQRQHRRQHSTPNAFEPVKAQLLPTVQRHGSHRRGISLDQRRRQTPPQELMVSRTNPGYTTTPQHILRETRQQRPIRPGAPSPFQPFDNDENFMQSPAVTPHRQSFELRNEYGGNSQTQYSYPAPIDSAMNIDPAAYQGSTDFNLFSSEGILTPSSFLDLSSVLDPSMEYEASPHSSRPSSGRRISGGIVDRVAQFEQLALKSPQRPSTPPRQNGTNYFPLTPADTPQHRTIKQEHFNRRFLESYDTSMEETIKPRGNLRAKGVFEDMRRQAEEEMAMQVQKSAPLQHGENFDSAPMPTGHFMQLNDINLSFLKSEMNQTALQYSPMVPEISPALSYSSIQENQEAIFGAPFVNKVDAEAPPMSYSNSSHSRRSAAPLSPVASSHRRSESVSSINIEESITETGITIDDIAAFISGPDPVDNKWLCLYPECGKRFGRKENIKSHVQTHLGDRQYQCPHCNNRFVRQHDLKRHAKIHSGVKPYPCQCGNSFARHDALTRHRQRGMCIGAFEGVVKKVVKRGRPRKNRPDDEQRLEKSSRTRARNKKKATSSASSTTGYTSDSLDGRSPRSDADILDDKPFTDFEYGQSSAALIPQHSAHQSPGPVGCVSPQDIQANSPAQNDYDHSQGMSRMPSNQSVASSHHLPVLPPSPAKSSHSNHSLPGLCESSSSPAPSHYYDLDNASNHDDDNLERLSLAGIPEDHQMFLEAFVNNSADLSVLERDPGLLLGKFDDSYAQNEDLFRDAEDVFFGSP